MSSAGSSEGDREYEVGRGKPPKGSQFPKGKSGNPRGRPKGSKNQRLVFQDVMARSVAVREGDKRRTLSSYEAMLLAQRNKALQGDSKAFATLMAQADRFGMFQEEETKETVLTAVQRTAIEAFLRRRGIDPTAVFADN